MVLPPLALPSQVRRRCAALAFGLLVPSAALAGAWTEPQGQGLVIETLFGWGGAGAPYSGLSAPKESKFESQTYFEYGLWDRLTVFGDLAAMRYGLGPPSKDSFTGLDYSGGGLRARLWSDDAWVFSLEASAYATNAADEARPAQGGNTGPEADLRGLAGRNLTLVGSLILTPFVAPLWVTPPSAMAWAVLVGIGAFGATAHLLMILAHARAPAAVLAPFTYTQIIWALVSGFVIFGDVPHPITLLGALIVVLSGLYLWHREHGEKVRVPT